jgi:tight adherence protein C
MHPAHGIFMSTSAALIAAALVAAKMAGVQSHVVVYWTYSSASVLFAVAGALTLIERRARLQRVMAAVSKRSSRSRGEARAWRIGLLALMRGLTRRVVILKDRQVEDTRRLLVSAGFRSRDAIVVYSFFKITAPLLALLSASIYIFLISSTGYGLAADVGVVAAAALLGSKLPDVIVSKRRNARMHVIQKGMPDTLDMLVICAEAGLASDAALKRVVAEAGRRPNALTDELGLMVLELTYMASRRDALENLAVRAPLPSVQAFCNTLIQAERYGTPLARAFKVLSHEQRGERMLRAEEKAGRLPATMTVPMMMFILPALFIVLIGPAILDIMDNFIGMGN